MSSSSLEDVGGGGWGKRRILTEIEDMMEARVY